jgi:hypothetical protein
LDCDQCGFDFSLVHHRILLVKKYHYHPLLDTSLKESILLGKTFAPDEFRSCFRRWCPSAMSPGREGTGGCQVSERKRKEAEISDEEAEDWVNFAEMVGLTFFWS